MDLGAANDLLAPGYLRLESGYTRLADGQLHVAAWTTLPGCSGRMVEWWFGYLETTEQYKWWHPEDHVWCEWVGRARSSFRIAWERAFSSTATRR